MKCIQLTRGLVAIVDDEDFERLAQWRWHANSEDAIRAYRTAALTLHGEFARLN